MARFYAEPQRPPPRLELGATTQTERRVSVRIAAATHQWRDRLRGGARAGEYLGPAGDGVGLVGRESQRGVVRLQRIPVPAGAGQRLAHRYVELEPEDPWGYMAVGETIGRVGVVRIGSEH